MDLSSDATIPDLLNTLINPGNYVRRVLQTMYELRRDHGEVTVRIGIQGQGRAPHYRIDSAASGEPIEAFDGSTGKPFTDYTRTHAQNWSTKSMRFDEVRRLRGTLND